MNVTLHTLDVRWRELAQHDVPSAPAVVSAEQAKAALPGFLAGLHGRRLRDEDVHRLAQLLRPLNGTTEHAYIRNTIANNGRLWATADIPRPDRRWQGFLHSRSKFNAQWQELVRQHAAVTRRRIAKRFI